MANCNKLCAFASAFAPASSNKNPPPSVVGSVGLKAGRSIPFILPTENRPLTAKHQCCLRIYKRLRVVLSLLLPLIQQKLLFYVDRHVSALHPHVPFR